jgi:tRNA pseudouridine65 synthase
MASVVVEPHPRVDDEDARALAFERIVVREVALEHGVALLVLDELRLHLRVRARGEREHEEHGGPKLHGADASVRTVVTVLHRDERCVAVAKPSGVATHRGWADDERALLQLTRDAVGAYVYPVHRLDRGASGIVLFALDADAARAFAEAWPHADKRYLAITRGHPDEHLVVDHAIPNAAGVRVPAVTELWRRETFGRYALVEARLMTGRLHQVRRHLKHVSCPIIGDVRYGKGEHNRLWRERCDLHRLALHARSLRVAHPDGGEVVVDCPLAEDLTHALQVARRVFGGAAADSEAPS